MGAHWSNTDARGSDDLVEPLDALLNANGGNHTGGSGNDVCQAPLDPQSAIAIEVSNIASAMPPCVSREWCGWQSAGAGSSARRR